MSSPNLNRVLLLEVPTRTPDGGGGFSEGWATLGEVWADVRARTGRERNEAGLPLSTVGYRIVVRAAPAGHPQRPMPDQRFRDGNRLFLIRAVAENDASGRYLTCFADEEVVA